MSHTLPRLHPDQVSALWTVLVGKTGRHIKCNVSTKEQVTDEVSQVFQLELSKKTTWRKQTWGGPWVEPGKACGRSWNPR